MRWFYAPNIVFFFGKIPFKFRVAGENRKCKLGTPRLYRRTALASEITDSEKKIECPRMTSPSLPPQALEGEGEGGGQSKQHVKGKMFDA